MKRKISIIFAFVLICGLSGCGKTDILAQYDTRDIEFIAYTDIDTVCDNQELTAAGKTLLSSMEESLLLSYMIDSAIEITNDELGEYDHLVITNPQWVKRFADSDKLRPVEYSSLTEGMQEFLGIQMPLLTVDASVLSNGVNLYEYEEGGLLAFPVNVTLGAAKPIETKHPLIILVDKPTEILKADSCMLPLTSSGNVLFTDGDKLRTLFEKSKLKDYGEIQTLKEVVK